MLLFVAPRAVWTRQDDWGATLGLKGSGSHSITMERAFVPARFVLENAWMVDADPSANPGVHVHESASYGGRTLAIFQVGLTALAIGGVRAALDEYEHLIRTRNTQRPPIVKRCEDPDYQLWFGRAIGRVAAAEAAIMGLLRRHEELCRRSVANGIPYTREDDLRLNIVARDALTLAWTALQDDIFRTAGTSAAVNGTRLERVFRDVVMDWGHFGNIIRDWAARELAREHLGLAAGRALRPDREHTVTRS
jgi:3-hydroxy-9,10-secoandrosta-1,3,5(10)-triene-9,17-dione monooxygenase